MVTVISHHLGHNFVCPRFVKNLNATKKRPLPVGLTCVISCLVSFQMCIEGSSLANAISLCFVFSIVRTFFFIGKGWFYLEFFPKEHFGALYLISNIPAGVANFVVDPIYDGKVNLYIFPKSSEW